MEAAAPAAIIQSFYEGSFSIASAPIPDAFTTCGASMPGLGIGPGRWAPPAFASARAGWPTRGRHGVHLRARAGHGSRAGGTPGAAGPVGDIDSEDGVLGEHPGALNAARSGQVGADDGSHQSCCVQPQLSASVAGHLPRGFSNPVVLSQSASYIFGSPSGPACPTLEEPLEEHMSQPMLLPDGASEGSEKEDPLPGIPAFPSFPVSDYELALELIQSKNRQISMLQELLQRTPPGPFATHLGALLSAKIIERSQLYMIQEIIDNETSAQKNPQRIRPFAFAPSWVEPLFGPTEAFFPFARLFLNRFIYRSAGLIEVLFRLFLWSQT